jgi:hypothetical protein
MTAVKEARAAFLRDNLDQQRKDQANKRQEFATMLESFIGQVPLKAKAKAEAQVPANGQSVETHRGELLTIKAHCVNEQLLEWPIRVIKLLHYAQGIDRPNQDEFAMLCRVLGLTQAKVTELFRAMYPEFSWQDPPQARPISLSPEQQKARMSQALDRFMADHEPVKPQPRPQWTDLDNASPAPSAPEPQSRPAKTTAQASQAIAKPPIAIAKQIDVVLPSPAKADYVIELERQLEIEGSIDTSTFYAKVRQLRDIPLDHLSRETGVSTKKLLALETSPQAHLDIGGIRKLAQALGVSAKILFQAHRRQLGT